MPRVSRTLAARVVADLRAPLSACRDPFAFGVGLDGRVFAAARSSHEPHVDRKGPKSPSFPKSQFAAKTNWTVVCASEGEVASVVVADETLVVHHVQPMPDGVLLAGARCRYTAEGGEKNALVFGDGRVLRRFVLGDGVQDLRCDSRGTIWVSFFDEGVFGNYGWGSQGTPAPMGATGLLAFDPQGQQTFSYDAQAAGTDHICDAYAFNLAGDDDAWVYFYTQFPIVRIQGGRYTAWSCEIAGANALAVRGHRVLLFGGYKARTVAHVLRLTKDGRSEVVDRLSVGFPEGVALDGLQARGVGPDVYFLSDRRVMRLDDW